MTNDFPFQPRILVLALALTTSCVSNAANISVTGDCTLVAAINNANSDSDTDGVGFGCKAGNGADILNLGLNTTYALTEVINNQTGLPLISSVITINGNDSTITRSTAPNTPSFRLLRVTADGYLKLNKITLTGGIASYDDNKPKANRQGGAILNKGTVTLNECIITNNQAEYGGGIANKGHLTLNHSTISNNGKSSVFGFPAYAGGGILNDGILVLNDSTVFNNGYDGAFGFDYTRDGGGILNRRSMTINNSTISGNAAQSNGGIHNIGTMVLNKSTVSNNSSSYNSPLNGAGIANSGNLTLSNSTISNNSTRNYYGQGGVGGIVNTGKITLSRSIVKNNKGIYSSGIWNVAEGNMRLENSSVSNNFSFGGPAFVNLGKMVAVDSTISHNGGEYSGNGGTSNYGTMTVSNSRIVNNHGGNNGFAGGLRNGGKLTISDSIISGNINIAESGGAIRNFSKGTVSLTNTIITNNEANGGGGIANSGVMTLSKVLVAGNKAVYQYNLYSNVYSGGGGLYNKGSISLVNTTLSGNSTDKLAGGGIANKGNLSMTHSTVTGNTAVEAGGGIKNYLGAELMLGNSVVANSKIGGDCHNEGIVNLSGKNLIEDGSCGAGLSGDPKLAPLLDNGGPTPTHALLVGSPAINSADKSLCLATDQRNAQRPIFRKEACDLGAYERLQTSTLPNDMIAVMNFLSAQIANGAIIGIGNTNFAANRLDAFKSQLYLAAQYELRNKTDELCTQLAQTFKHIDLDNTPEGIDYVTGTAAVELANQINALHTEWQCQ